QQKRETFWEFVQEKKDELLGETFGETSAISPQNTLTNSQLEQEFALTFATIRTIRNLRAEAGIKPGMKVNVILQSESEKERDILSNTEKYIRDLAKVEELTVTSALKEDKEQVIAGVVGTIQVLIPLAGVVDVEVLRSKLEKNLNKVE
ncbi:hypothetical protein R0K05_17520, partial [Planococcus sp. SIMBA_160]